MRVLCASSVRVGVCGVCVCSGDLEYNKEGEREKIKKGRAHRRTAPTNRYKYTYIYNKYFIISIILPYKRRRRRRAWGRRRRRA